MKIVTWNVTSLTMRLRRLLELLVSAEIAGTLVSCEIARDDRKGSKPSDHAPLVVELEA